MTIMEREMVMYDNKVWGVKVSDHGLKNGRLDYTALANILGDCIHNDYVREEFPYDWELVNGDVEEDDIVSQDYIITEYGCRILRDYTDELVFYNERLDMYIWCVTHFGTSWDYVLTNIKLVDGDKQ